MYNNTTHIHTHTNHALFGFSAVHTDKWKSKYIHWCGTFTLESWVFWLGCVCLCESADFVICSVSVVCFLLFIYLSLSLFLSVYLFLSFSPLSIGPFLFFNIKRIFDSFFLCVWFRRHFCRRYVFSFSRKTKITLAMSVSNKMCQDLCSFNGIRAKFNWLDFRSHFTSKIYAYYSKLFSFVFFFLPQMVIKNG